MALSRFSHCGNLFFCATFHIAEILLSCYYKRTKMKGGFSWKTLLSIHKKKLQERKFALLSTKVCKMQQTTISLILTNSLTNWKRGIMPINDYRIAFTTHAKDDIISIGDYITFTLLEPDISKKFKKGLRNSINQLKYFPYKFPLVQDDILQGHGIRYMPHKIIMHFIQLLKFYILS